MPCLFPEHAFNIQLSALVLFHLDWMHRLPTAVTNKNAYVLVGNHGVRENGNRLSINRDDRMYQRERVSFHLADPSKDHRLTEGLTDLVFFGQIVGF